MTKWASMLIICMLQFAFPCVNQIRVNRSEWKRLRLLLSLSLLFSSLSLSLSLSVRMCGFNAREIHTISFIEHTVQAATIEFTWLRYGSIYYVDIRDYERSNKIIFTHCIKHSILVKRYINYCWNAIPVVVCFTHQTIRIRSRVRYICIDYLRDLSNDTFDSGKMAKDDNAVMWTWSGFSY